MEKKLISEIHRTLKLMNIVESSTLLNEANIGPELEIIFSKIVSKDLDAILAKLKSIYPKDIILNSAEQRLNKIAKFIAGDATKLETVLELAIKDGIIPVTNLVTIVEKNAPKLSGLIKQALEAGVDFQAIEARYGPQLAGLPREAKTELYRSLQSEVQAAVSGVGVTSKMFASDFITTLQTIYPELAKKSWFGFGKPYFKTATDNIARDLRLQLIGKEPSYALEVMNKRLAETQTLLSSSGALTNPELRGLEGTLRKMGSNLRDLYNPFKIFKAPITDEILKTKTFMHFFGTMALATYTIYTIKAAVKNKGVNLAAVGDVFGDDVKTMKNAVKSIWNSTGGGTNSGTGTQQDFTKFLLDAGYKQEEVDAITIKDLGNGRFVVNGKTFVYDNGTFIQK